MELRTSADDVLRRTRRQRRGCNSFTRTRSFILQRTTLDGMQARKAKFKNPDFTLDLTVWAIRCLRCTTARI